MIAKSACPDILLMASIGVIKIWQLCSTQSLLLSYYLFIPLHRKFVVVINSGTDSNFQTWSSSPFFGPESPFPPKPKALYTFCGTIQVVIFNNNETCLWGFGQYTDCRIKHQWNWPASRCLLRTVVGIQLKACAASLRCLWQTKHLACLSFASYFLLCVWV